MDTQYEPSGIEKFFAGANFLLQICLALGAVFYFSFIVDLPPALNIIATIFGLLIFPFISIVSSAYAHRNAIHTNILEAGMKASAHSKKSKPHLEIPPLKGFLIRSAIAFFIFIIGIAILIAIGTAIMFGVMSYIVPLTPDNERMELIVSMMVTLPIIITGLGLIVGMYIVAPAIVDATIYKNELIIAHLYEENEKPMTPGKFAKGTWSVLRISLGLGLAVAFVIGMRVGLNILDEADPPFYIFCSILVLMLIPILAFSWWSIKRGKKHETEKRMQQMEDNLIEQFGEDSLEVQIFRAEIDQFNALSDKEKKQLTKEEKEANKDKEEPFSVMMQIYKRMPVFLFGGIVFSCIASVGVTFGIAQFGVQGEMLGSIGTLSFLIILTIGIFIFFARLGAIGIKLPEELTQMGEAVDSGDYVKAVELAEIVRDKIDLREFGYIIGAVYYQAGDIEKAEAITRESLKQIMFIEEANRNAVFLSLTLTMLGAILIISERYEEAEITLKQSLQQNNKNPITLGNLAEVNLFMGYAEQALDYVERAIKVNEKKPEAEKLSPSILLILKAWALTGLEQYEETAKLMREAFHLVGDKKSAQAGLHYYAGHIALTRGKTTTAYIAFQRAIDTDPNSIIAIKAQEMLAD